jgi:hypothetical protein
MLEAQMDSGVKSDAVLIKPTLTAPDEKTTASAGRDSSYAVDCKKVSVPLAGAGRTVR